MQVENPPHCMEKTSFENKKIQVSSLSLDLFLMTVAEGEGFEPSIRKNRITDFESVAFDLSAILPH